MADHGVNQISDKCSSYSVQNTEAQASDEYESEIVPDSDDEGTHTGEVLAHTSLLSSCPIEGHSETKTIAMGTKQEILCNSCHPEPERAAVNAFCIENKEGQCYADSSMFNTNHVYDKLEHNEEAKEEENDSRNFLTSGRNTFDRCAKDVNMQVACSLEESEREQKQRSSSRFDEKVGFGSKTQGSDELSLAHSLDFVDHYLSAHLEDVTPWVTSVVCEKSQCSISNAKGPQHLVSLTRLANLKSRTNDEGAFKWVDDLEDELKHNYQLLSGSEDLEQILIRRPMNVEDMDLRKQRIYPPVRKPRDHCLNINENPRYFRISGGIMPLSDVRKARNDGLRPNLESAKVSSEELDLLINRKSHTSKLEASVDDIDADFYEVGIGTQIAAEAMEALCYADPSSDAHQYPADTSDGLANVTTKIICSEVGSIQKSPCSKPVVSVNHKKSGVCSKKQRRKSFSSIQDSYSGDETYQEPAKKLRTYKALSTSSKTKSYLKNSTSLDQYSDIAKLKTTENLRGVVQSKGKKNIRKRVLYKGNSGRQCDKFLPVTRGRRLSIPSRSLNLSRNSDGNCQNGKINLKVEDAGPCKKRKRKDIIADNWDVSKESKNSLNVSFEISVDGKIGSISQGVEQQIDRDAIFNLQNFNLLDYPRGKRTSRVKMGSCLSGSGFIHPVKLMNMSESNSDSIQSPFSCPIKRKKRTSVYRSIPISIHRKKSCGNLQGRNKDELGLIDIVHEHDSIVKGGKVINVSNLNMGLDQFKNQSDTKSSSSLFLGKNDASSVQSSNSASAAFFKCRMSTNEVHPHNTMSSHGKHPDKKRESTSLLTKELVRLGCVDSMPDFTSKDMRRRRTMANIQVLLSQNLEKDIFKQQKKILAWFGVPMASCPSDATHFVADKFTRTRNTLETIALGKPVVTHLWLENCKEAGFCIDERKYILRDVKKERELGFSLPNSLIQAGRKPLLTGYKVYVTPNVKPTQEVISSLVKTLQGELVTDAARDFQSKEKIVDNFLILSCEEDYADCNPLLQKGATAYTSELLLNGVIIQKLEFQRCPTCESFIQHIKLSLCPFKSFGQLWHRLIFNHLASK